MNKDELAVELTAPLKEIGFRKKGQTWCREQPGIIEVFNIQGSSWDKNDWYLNVGVFLRALDEPATWPSEASCHIRERLPPTLTEPSEIIAAARKWFGMHDSVQKLASLELKGRLRGFVLARAREHLRSNGG